MPKRSEPLYLRGDVYWCRVRDRSGKIVRRSTHCKDRDAALREFRNIEREAVDQDYAASAKATLSECVVDYFADLARRRVSKDYLKIAEVKCGHIARIFGAELPMSRIDSKLVHAFVDKRQAEGAADFTIYKMELAHLRQVLRLARHHGKFHLDIDRVMPPYLHATPRRITRAPSQQEVARLVAELEPRRGAHVAFICATGARLGESFRARRSDVRASVVAIRGTKTDASAASVPITSISRPTLEWALANAPGDDVLFHAWGKIGRDIKAACVRAGIEKVTPNDLRRAFGTWHREAGVSVEMVSKLLRHTTDTLAQTTYARIGAEAVGVIVEQALLLGAPAPKEAVPDLYPPTAQTGASGANEPTSEAGFAGKMQENSGAPESTRNSDLGFRKAYADASSKRRSTGTKLGLLRAAQASTVPPLYDTKTPENERVGEGARAKFPLSEAVANLACLLAGVSA